MNIIIISFPKNHIRLLICILLMSALAAMTMGKEVHFKGNTKIMYEKMISKVPFFLQKKARADLDNAIEEVCTDGVVTDDRMVVLAEMTTPRLFLQRSLDIINEHRTE